MAPDYLRVKFLFFTKAGKVVLCPTSYLQCLNDAELRVFSKQTKLFHASVLSSL